MPINTAVGEAFRALRLEHGLSQERFAEEVDSHQVYISEIETGKKIPSLPMLYKTARAFDLSLSEFAALIEARLD